MISLQDLGEEIAHTRGVRRLSVRRLAAEAGVSPAWLAALERAEIADPSLPRVVRVLNSLDLDLRVRGWHGGRPDLDELREENERLRREMQAAGMSPARFRWPFPEGPQPPASTAIAACESPRLRWPPRPGKAPMPCSTLSKRIAATAA